MSAPGQVRALCPAGIVVPTPGTCSRSLSSHFPPTPAWKQTWVGQPLFFLLWQGPHALEALQVQLPAGLLQPPLSPCCALQDQDSPWHREERPHPAFSFFFFFPEIFVSCFVAERIKC